MMKLFGLLDFLAGIFLWQACLGYEGRLVCFWDNVWSEMIVFYSSWFMISS